MSGARTLGAGPLIAALDGLDLLDVRFGGVEVVRRIGVRVRDPDWETIPPGDVAVAEHPDGFACELRARHRSGPLDFAWRGSITVTRDSLVYAMNGRAASAFGYGRIGLCILHPPEAAGRPYRARSGNGTTKGTLPELIAPQPIVAGVASPLVAAFTRLELDLDPGLTVVFELEGDLFEMEDQRNWADGSFKSYSTPVALPTPIRVQPGAEIRQLVRVRVVGAAPPRRRGGAVAPWRGGAPPRRRAAEEVRLRLGTALGATLPAVGLGLDSDGRAPEGRALDRLRELAPAHVRSDLDLARADAVEALARATGAATAIGAELELALLLAGDEGEVRDALQRLGGVARPPLARLIVLHRDEWVTGARWLRLVRPAPGSAVPVIVGTAFHFAELNRARPEGGDGLVYALTPQAHDSDDTTLVHSLQAQRSTVETARAFAAGRPVHVSPVTLKPRRNPYAADRLQAEPPADERQPTPFAAAWTLGSVKHLAEAGAASLTYFELTGPRGVVSRDGEPFPVHRVLRDVCARRGQPIVGCTSEAPQAVEALVVRSVASLEGIVANLTSRRQRVMLEHADGRPAARLDLAPYAVELVDIR